MALAFDSEGPGRLRPPPGKRPCARPLAVSNRRTPGRLGSELSRPTAVWPFAISLLYVGDRVDVHVCGSLDTATAPLLRSVLGRLADDGHVRLRLDLARLDIMDAAGARVIAFVAARLRGLDAWLTVRGATSQVRHALRLGGWDTLIDFEAGEGSDPRAAAFSGDGAATRFGVSPSVFDLWPAERPGAIDAALRLVTSLAHATVAGADGVSVSLRRNGVLVTVAASDDRIAQMDQDQYATGEGPCLTAAADDCIVEVPSLGDEVRWPSFTPRARRLGIASILSSPIHSPTGPLGALNMYSKTEAAFGTHQRAISLLFAEQASGILTQGDDGEQTSVTGSRLQDALVARTAIAHAEGVLMARTGQNADEASATMRGLARRTGRDVREVADEVLAAIGNHDVGGAHG